MRFLDWAWFRLNRALNPEQPHWQWCALMFLRHNVVYLMMRIVDTETRRIYREIKETDHDHDC